MKRTVVVAALVAAVAIVATSCGSSPAQATNDPVSQFIREARRSAPEGAILGIGTSNLPNMAIARSTAEARARAEIARQVEVVVTNMIEVVTIASEAERDALLSYQSDTTRTLANQTQQGATIFDENVINGNQITIVILTVDALRNGIMGANESMSKLSPHAGAAFFSLDRMDAELAKQNALPPVVRDQN